MGSEEQDFREVDFDTFEEGWKEAARAVAARPPLTQEEIDAGWEEIPWGSGLRRNIITGEWDDSCFVHISPSMHVWRSERAEQD